MAVSGTTREKILIRGAKEHNLKNIDVILPRFKLVVITGVSGSGKSSLAFDTLYAEGQRRYVESLSSYARQFIGQMEKPKVDFIGGLSPAIAIEQKAVSRNPRSTVATVTEIYDYLRVLFARVGAPHCPECGREVRAQSAQEIVEQVAALPAGERFQVLALLARNRKGTFKDTFAQARADGFSRARVDGEVRDLGEAIKLDKNKKHDVALVVDRLVAPENGGGQERDAFITRLTDSVETALRASEGLIIIDRGDGGDWLLSEKNACPDCGISFPELTPAMFSFNSPMGMCPECNGLGTKIEFDPDRFVDPDKSLHEGGVRTFGELDKKKSSGTYKILRQIVEKFNDDMDIPWRALSEECRQAILYGGVTVNWQSESDRGEWQGEWEFEGTINATRRRYRRTKSDGMRRWYRNFMSQQPCSTCHGQRLRPESAAVTVGKRTINEVTAMSIGEALRWVEKLWSQMTPEQTEIAEEVLKEIHERIQFLLNVGLHYLTLNRSAPTLSGGEGQRIRLASQIGCGLVGVLYVLDEPSIGLHQRDNRRLLDTLEHLRDMGNTVVVVEHDEETIRTADWVLDLGPGAGVNGGYVVAAGPLQEIEQEANSLTGRYLRGDLEVTSPNGQRRPVNGKWLTIVGARQNNLKDLSVRFPLGLFTCVTGVSGSGKSSLVAQTFHPALAAMLHRAEQKPGDHDCVEGLEYVDKVINITQDPIGRTPRSNPATYANVLTPIRELLAKTPEAKVRGYEKGRFSFNVKGGRCEACKGHGKKRVEMHFLPDVWVTCNVCKGTRFNRETLQIRYKGKTITDVLDMDVEEALDFFGNAPKIKRILQTLVDVGLGYVKLGQSATTLSGGEAQRVKLAKELARVSTGDTVYILDEPTTGLHFADIQKLLDVLHRLTDAGNTVIVIEHNLDVIKTADWIVDLGPEGGDEGGYIVAQGAPEEVAQVEGSYTGQFLKNVLCRSERKNK
ncbi:MAG: excinuclease ABC subunit A [Anaerolineaceae bacterium 4572_32.2]|nr:MAG: excinuclease ABC subunit A [Anaerolineaceae bacterium 4572_32.2]